MSFNKLNHSPKAIISNFSKYLAIDTGILNSQDKLYIYDGPNENSTALPGTSPYLFGKVAGIDGLGPVVLTSSGQDVFLRFTSDWYYTWYGFAITYEQGKSKATCFKRHNVAIFKMVHFPLTTKPHSPIIL